MDMRAFSIDAPGGTGKSYLLNAFLASVRLLSEESIALAMAASGIAATLLLMGRTFHSRFKAPLTVTETSTLSISKQSNLTELIRRTKLIVWDEAPMTEAFVTLRLSTSRLVGKSSYLQGIFGKYYLSLNMVQGVKFSTL